MPDPLNQVPEVLIAGTTWKWDRDLTDFPAPTWAATWYFENGRNLIEIVGTASGTKHRANVAAATTASYTPGKYRWQMRVADATEVFVPDGERGWLDVRLNPAASGKADLRSHARKMVDALEALALNRAAGGRLSVSVDGVSASFESLAAVSQALTYWRNQLEAEEQAERIEQGLGSRRTIRTRFVSP